MRDEPRISTLPMTAAYFRLILRRFGSSAAKRNALLAGVARQDEKANASPDAQITVRTQLRQLAHLNQIAAAGWGLELGAALDAAAHGPAGTAIVTAASLADAVDVLTRYANVRTPFIDLRASCNGERYVLRVIETCRLGAVRLPVLEMVLLSTQEVLESALGRQLGTAIYTLPPPRPAYWRRYEKVFHAPVTFAGREASVSFPTEWLDWPCPLADALLHRSASRRLEAMRQQIARDFVDTRVEAILEAADDVGLSLVEVAARLRVSTRTLVRRLRKRNTSYRRLIDGHRRRRAIELLLQPELAVAEVAERLGYEDATNFSRACRRWFGKSPRAYRARPRF